MSERKANERPKYTPKGGPMGHGPRVAEKSVNFWSSLKRLIRHLRPERLQLSIVLIFVIVSVGGSAWGPKILAAATNVIFAGVIGKNLPAGTSKAEVIEQLQAEGKTDYAKMLQGTDVIPGQGIDFGQISQILTLALAVYAVSGIFMWLSGVLINRLTQRSVYRMRGQVADKLDRLPLSYFDKQSRGELLSRVTNDIDNVAQTMQQTLSQVFTALLTIIAVLAMMLSISPILTLIALATIVISIILAAFIGTKSQKLFATMWKATGEVSSHVDETFTGHTLVRVFGRATETENEFLERNDRLYRSARGAQFMSGIIMPVMFLVSNLNYVVVAVLGGLRVASGQLSLGDVQAFIQYSRQFSQPVTQLASMANILQSGVASVERVFEVLDEPEEKPDQTGTLDVVTGRVEFAAVDFSYDANKPLIEDLNLVVDPGSTVAIVGPTGAGKTTLVNLLERFYEVDAGRITIDGTDISTVPRSELRSHIGMVLQDTWLFGGTISDNIAYGKPDATQDEIIAAAKATYVDRFVRSLPKGYDTILSDEASNISVGEKQLLTIARAFLANRSILILDEATSSVDTRTEVLVQRAMNKLRRDKTSFVIAHRLSTIRDADVIVVMESGRIVEQGSHDALLEREGAYARLYQSQFAGVET